MWKILIVLGGKSKVSALPVPNIPIPNHMNVNIGGKEPQQSVNKRGRPQRISSNKQTNKNN